MTISPKVPGVKSVWRRTTARNLPTESTSVWGTAFTLKFTEEHYSETVNPRGILPRLDVAARFSEYPTRTISPAWIELADVAACSGVVDR